MFHPALWCECALSCIVVFCKTEVINCSFSLVYKTTFLNTLAHYFRAVFLNRRALASLIPGRERFFWNLSF